MMKRSLRSELMLKRSLMFLKFGAAARNGPIEMGPFFRGAPLERGCTRLASATKPSSKRHELDGGS